jgi:ectoine hydroxylase-related dioxygenase (phytanoyl-CoA dioxygenase family)
MSIPEKFAGEIEGYVSELREEGWCVIPSVIPADAVDAVREEVETSQADYQAFSKEHGRWTRNVIAFMPNFATHLAEERVMSVMKAFLGPQVRISQTEYKIRPPHYELVRAYHSDFPYDLNQKWHIEQPFPPTPIGITTLWMLSPFSTDNGGTWIVPKTHVDLKNPRGKNDGIDERAPIPNEFQVTGSAGSVLFMDSRIWHSNAANPDDKPRTAVVVRYAPWWLNLELYGVNQATLPAEAFEQFPDDVKMLYEHRVDGLEPTIWA